MKHKESDLQIRCIKWFRYQYPAFARLMEHPKNEGNGNRRQGAIAKAEGVQAGVADLILHVPSFGINPESSVQAIYYSLAIELKTQKGTQSPEQKQWQRLFEATGSLYIIIRSYDDFVSEITRYMLNVPMYITEKVKETHADIERQQQDKARQQLRSLFNKK